MKTLFCSVLSNNVSLFEKREELRTVCNISYVRMNPKFQNPNLILLLSGFPGQKIERQGQSVQSHGFCSCRQFCSCLHSECASHCALFLSSLPCTCMLLSICTSWLVLPAWQSLIRGYRFSMEWQTEPVNVGGKYFFFCPCHLHQLTSVISCCFRFSEPSRSAVLAVTQSMSEREIIDYFWYYIMIIHASKYYLCQAVFAGNELFESYRENNCIKVHGTGSGAQW